MSDKQLFTSKLNSRYSRAAPTSIGSWDLTHSGPIDMFLKLHGLERQEEWEKLLHCADNELQTLIESMGLTASSVIYVENNVGASYLLLKFLRGFPDLWAALKSNPNTGADLFASNVVPIKRVLIQLQNTNFKIIDGNECWPERSL
jgi:hypothetical protein